jgi:hypothetical protein
VCAEAPPGRADLPSAGDWFSGGQDEPVPGLAYAEPPDWLTESARALWDRLAKQLEIMHIGPFACDRDLGGAFTYGGCVSQVRVGYTTWLMLICG